MNGKNKISTQYTCSDLIISTILEKGKKENYLDNLPQPITIRLASVVFAVSQLHVPCESQLAQRGLVASPSAALKCEVPSAES